MARSRIGGNIQKKIVMLIYGEQFTGKSTMALQAAYFKRPDGKPFRILYLDAESGSIDYYLPELEADGIDTRNIYIVYTQSLSEVKDYISKVKNKEDMYFLDDNGEETSEVVLDADGEPFRPDVVVVDGSTVLNLTTKNGLVEFSKKRNAVKAKKREITGEERLVMVEGAGLELKDYNTINFKGQDLILDLVACGVNCIITAREVDEKETVKDSNGNITSISTGRKIPEGFKGMGYNVHTELRMFRDEETGMVCCHVKKDRTHTHKDNEIIENPTLLDWKSVIDTTSKYENFVVKNSLNEAIQTEQKIFEKETLKRIENIDTVTGNKENTVLSAEELKKEIANTISNLSPEKKKKFKEMLVEKRLPTAITKITEIDILKSIKNALFEI